MSQPYIKETEQKRGTKLYHLISATDWNTYNQQYAYNMALQEANKLKPSRMQGSPAGCLYDTKVIVPDAYFELTNGGGLNGGGQAGWGLWPQSARQCINVQTPDQPCLQEGPITGPGQPTTTTYTPGGKTPPCPGGVEGCCNLTERKTQWLNGSSWTEKYLRSSGIRLNFKYQVFPNNLIGRPVSSNRTCVPPRPFPLKTHSVAWQGSIAINQRSRPYSFYEKYTCKCNCEPAKVAQIVPATSIIPGLSPCYSIQTPAQAQALIDAAYSALAVGACVVAIALLAQATAIIIGTALAAGCAYQMIMISAPCPQQGGQGGT